jgi:hypothetical protein
MLTRLGICAETSVELSLIKVHKNPYSISRVVTLKTYEETDTASKLIVVKSGIATVPK